MLLYTIVMTERSPRVRILSGTYHPEFAEAVANQLDLEVDPVTITRFANTEMKAEVPIVRGDHVFVIQSHGAPVSETIMEQRHIINAARRASAHDVTAVVPYRGYGRADRPDNSHESYMGPLVMRDLISAGANRILEVDPHAGQSAGFLPDFSSEYTPIPSSPVIREYIQHTLMAEGDPDDIVIVSPDSGRAKLNRRYAEHFKKPRAIVDKLRTGANQTEAMEFIGNVAGKRCIMIDDMIDTAGTIVAGAELLMKNDAREVTLIATHGLLSGPAIERLRTAKVNRVVSRIAVTDTLRLPHDTPEGLIEVVSVAPLVGQAIHHIHNGKSVSVLFD